MKNQNIEFWFDLGDCTWCGQSLCIGSRCDNPDCPVYGLPQE